MRTCAEIRTELAIAAGYLNSRQEAYVVSLKGDFESINKEVLRFRNQAHKVYPRQFSLVVRNNQLTLTKRNYQGKWAKTYLSEMPPARNRRKPHPHADKKGGHIYAIRFGTYIKFGFSTSPQNRLDNLPHEEVLYLGKGSLKTEQRMHRSLPPDARIVMANGMKEWYDSTHPSVKTTVLNLQKGIGG